MKSATVHRLHTPKPQPDAVTASELQAIEDHLDSPASGLVTSILAQALNIYSSNGERERTQRNAILAFGVRCVSAALLYLTQIVLARWMGETEYGIYVFVWTWVLILGGMSHLGLSLASIRLAPVYRETNDFDRLRGLMRGARFAALGFGTIVMLAGLAGVWLLQSRIDSAFVWPIYLALVCIPLYALTDVQDGIGRGNAWMSIALVPPYILRPLLLLATMFAAHMYNLPPNASTAAAAAIVATWSAGLIQTLFLSARMRETIPAGPRTYSFGPWLKTSLPLLVMLCCDLVMQNADILVISKYMSPANVGIYFAAGKTMALIMFVHYAVGSAVANKFAALNARGDKEGLRAFVKDAVNWTFWPSLAGAAIILALG